MENPNNLPTRDQLLTADKGSPILQNATTVSSPQRASYDTNHNHPRPDPRGCSDSYRQIQQRVGLSLDDFPAEFPNDAAAEDWFIQKRWPGGVQCPSCRSPRVSKRPTRKPQPFRCRECRFDFSVKTGTAMHSSNLSLRKWTKALYYTLAYPKEISAMHLSIILKVHYKTALHILQRVRKALKEDQPVFSDDAGRDTSEAEIAIPSATHNQPGGSRTR